MSVVKISDLPVGVTLTGSEVLPVVQVGGTRKSTVADLRAYMIGSIDPADIGAVPVERTVTVSGLLTGGGNLGANITISMAPQTGPVVLGVASGTASPTALSAPMLAVITAANAAAARVSLGLGSIATTDVSAYALAGHLHAVATAAAAGFLSAADKTKLDGIASGANAYVLPPAGISTLGGVKVGAGLAVALDGTLSAAVLSVAGKSGAVTLTGADVGLGLVENKTSATIRGELTSSNVTTALGFTPMSTSHPAAAITGFGSSGSATTVARSDHTHAYLPISGGTLTGSMTAPSLVLTSTDQIRLKNSTTAAGYGVVHRHDGDSYYILLTNNGDANGIWNALRPFRLVLATGQVYIQTGLTLSTSLTSTVATGTAPFSVLSTTTVTNLSADLLDGLDSTAFALAGHSHSYLPLAGGTLSGAVTIQGAPSLGSIGLVGGDTTHPGFIEFRTGDGVRRGYVGWSNGSSRLQLASENGWRWDFTDIVSCGGTNVSLEGHTHTAFGALSLSGVLTSTVATGTAPISVLSTTTVTNLSADLLDGHHAWEFPLSIATADDITARVGSGFYQTGGATVAHGWPETSNNWYHLISSTHSNPANYYALQFAGSFFDSSKLFYRATNGSGASAWLQVYTSGNLTGAWLGQDVRTTASPTFAGLNSNGAINSIGAITAPNAVFTSPTQIRLKSATTAANYGLLMHNDGSAFYLFCTNNNDANGGYNALRPFYFSLADGVVVLGNGVVVSGLCRPGTDNALALGSASYRWSEVYAATGTINTSDARQKIDLGADPLGLDFILALKPHAYRWRNGRRVHTGLFAQEVRAALPGGFNWAGWTLADPNDHTSLQGLRLDQLWAPTITSIQALHSRQQDAAARIDLITEQQQDAAERIAALESEVADLRTRLAA